MVGVAFIYSLIQLFYSLFSLNNMCEYSILVQDCDGLQPLSLSSNLVIFDSWD